LDHLTAIDAGFLQMETSQMPMCAPMHARYVRRTHRWRCYWQVSTILPICWLDSIKAWARWSMLIVAALMLGASRYEQLMVMLQISSAVLARRLQRLYLLEVLVSWQDPTDARRSVYRLDKAGQDLFANMLTL